MRASVLQDALRSAPKAVQAARLGLVQMGSEAWLGYQHARSPEERRHQLWLFFLYLSAVVLPLGSLLILLRWMYLRHHV